MKHTVLGEILVTNVAQGKATMTNVAFSFALCYICLLKLNAIFSTQLSHGAVYFI